MKTCKCGKSMVPTECREYEVGAGSHSFDTSDMYDVCSCGYYYDVESIRWHRHEFGIVTAVKRVFDFVRHTDGCSLLEYNSLSLDNVCDCGLNDLMGLFIRLMRN